MDATDDELLNWDAPFEEQPEVVKAAVTKFFGEDRVAEFVADNVDGQMLYDMVTERALSDPAIASMQLAYQGVKGIIYQDKKSHNVVAFNETHRTACDVISCTGTDFASDTSLRNCSDVSAWTSIVRVLLT